MHSILCGYPRTGSHWIRNVVEKSCSVLTFDIAERRVTYETKNVGMVKIHARNRGVARIKALWALPRHDFGHKFVYSYRDPRDAIISLYEMYMNQKGIAELNPVDFLKMYDPIRQYRWEIGSWVLKEHDDVFLVRFEELKQDPMTMFKELFTYLGYDAPIDPEAVKTRVATADSKKRPRGTAYGWKTAPDEYRPLVDAANAGLKREIELLGYANV